ncbi:hypothetical protein StoSoilA2_37030 [Arthrobacter sp. StoSoilA2]|uniref:DUF4956 domain-containing protein n=1 Tax=Arthrobacter sp. StoSoilA2 TaxID=2830990 RepID=UPI001CC66A91|nr:DUF4956 domain-containing protein [Arthrobacter sp. StoSoilA2]BCW37647.1 hypothetical protein StoSoilA2_37030 [Arthrobacter sp. StoSoilA2]
MNTIILIAADLAAITVLTFALYLRRHRRRDLVVSYLGMNVGVLAVATALSGSAAGIGLGLGLFGVLSIIRLRSTELAQHEVAYYFSALALGLIAGIGVEPLWLTLSLMGMVLLVMFVGDNPRVLPAYRHQTVVLDRAINNEHELHARLEEVLDGTVHSATIQELDLVNDKTIVDVRYAVRSSRVSQTHADSQGHAVSHDHAASQGPLGFDQPAGALTPAPEELPATQPSASQPQQPVPTSAGVS